MGLKESYSIIKDLGFNPKTIVDCGVAMGDWSVPIKGIFPNSLLLGIDANKWTDLDLVNGTNITEIVVLSDEDNKEMIFYQKKEMIENGSFCTGDSLFKENTHHYLDHNTIEKIVKTKSLKSILTKHNINQVDLLKLDTQGSELLILKGLGEDLLNIEFIELECSLVEYNLGGCSFYDVIEFLKPNFNIFDIYDLHRHYGKYLNQMDVIFQNKRSPIQKSL